MGYYCQSCQNTEDFQRRFYYNVDRTEWWHVDSEGDQVEYIDGEDNDSEQTDCSDVVCSECDCEADYDDREVEDFDEDGEPIFSESRDSPYSPTPSRVSNWKDRLEN